MKPRRHPHETPGFLESTSERWAAIFVVGIGGILLIANGLGWIHDITSYLQYNTTIGTSFILGSSGQEIYRINRASPMISSNDLDRPPK